jgi:hypothetical protein
MSGFDVVSDDMPNRLISDDAIEALIAGESVVGTPESLSAFVASLRERGQGAPSVPMSGQLLELVADGAPFKAILADPILVSRSVSRSVTRRGRNGRLASKVAAVMALIPAHLLVGATIAAAALGGAQAFGVVDLPLLPDPGRPVETMAPAELLPIDTRPIDSTVTTVTPATSPGAVVPVENETPGPRSRPDTPPTRQRPEPPGRQPVSSTLPSQASVDGKAGCELGQQTAAQPPQPPAPRTSQQPTQQPLTSDVKPAVEPCDRKSSEDEATAPDTHRGNDSGNDRSQDSPTPGRGTDNRPTSTDRHGIRQGSTPPGG